MIQSSLPPYISTTTPILRTTANTTTSHQRPEQEAREPVTLLSLPNELLAIVVSRLPAPALGRLLQTCKQLHYRLTPHLLERAQKPWFGLPPILQATEREHRSLVKLLLALGSCPNAVSSTGSTPLHLVKTAEMAEILLSGGADVARRNRHGLTALHYASSDAKLLELLAKRAGKEVINMKADAGGYTALHCSVRNGAWPVRVLLAHGADPGIIDSSGRTALHLAAGIGSIDAIKELLGHVDVGVQDHGGCTALHWAATWENWDAVRTLVEEGRSPLHLKSRTGKTARDVAAEKEWMDGVRYLERLAAGGIL